MSINLYNLGIKVKSVPMYCDAISCVKFMTVGVVVWIWQKKTFLKLQIVAC